MNRRPTDATWHTTALLLALLLSVGSASADIIVDRNTTAVGEAVRITILPAMQDQTLIVLAPNATFRFLGGVAEDTVFIPQQEGIHTIQLLAANHLVETASFTAGPTPAQGAPLPLLASTEVSTGEPIVINAPLDAREIIVEHLSQRFATSERSRPVTYIPDEPGIYDVTVVHANGSMESASVVASGQTTAPFAPGAETEPGAQEPFAAPGSGAFAKTAAGHVVNADLIWRQDGRIIKQTTTRLLDPAFVPAGPHELEMRLHGRSIRQITFKGLRYSPDAALGIEELVPEQITGAPRATLDAFAIDPSDLAFDTADVTFTATGLALYKCERYSFAARMCTGENVKLLDLVPGEQYTITINGTDPLFSQTGYLANPTFDTTTNSWTTLSEGTVAPTFSWIASDGTQSGVAQINMATRNRVAIGSYHQVFNLSIPPGTTLIGVNFSALWRIPAYVSSNPGWVNLSIQNPARTSTYCNVTSAFSGVTAWASLNTTTGAASCPLGNFAANTNYTFRLQCYLSLPNTQGANVACRWDNANITVWYNDTTAPVLRAATETPDPVDYGEPLNISVNITDNIAVGTTLIELLGVNYSLQKGSGDIYYYDVFSTARAPGVYYYKLFANDTNNNRITNSSAGLNFTIRDVRAPNITLISPEDPAYTPNTSFTARFNVSDQVGASSCQLNLSGTLANSTTIVPLDTTLNLSAALTSDGQYWWNITCNDTSGNRNISQTRRVTRDTQPPTVALNIRNDSFRSNQTVLFNMTAQDANVANCTLWANFTGTWAANATVLSPVSGSPTLFPPVDLTEGKFLWNVQCTDLAGNHGWNATNRTITIDRVAPAYSQIALDPPSGTPYAPAATYQLNVTWTDAALETVLLETDFGGSLMNITPTKAGDTYTATFTDRPAGTYSYRWYANDSAGNPNQTGLMAYTIAKATPLLELTLAGVSENITVSVDSTINITGRLITPSAGMLELYFEGQLINTANAYVSNLTQLTVEKRYNITLLYPATANHTEQRVTLFADVIDTTPPKVTLGSPENDSVHSSAVEFFFTPYDNVEIGNCTVILDGILNATKDVAKGVQDSITIVGISDGPHTWTVNCSDTTNNTAVNSSIRTVIIDTQPPTTFGLTSPSSGTASSELSPTLTWEQTSDASFSNYTVEVDNDVTFGTVNYNATLSPITNTSKQFTLDDQFVWYWRVTAKDKASNERLSTQVFNYTADAQAPALAQLLPANDTHLNTSSVRINYTPNDFTNITSCSLYLNGTLNQTNTTITRAATNSFTLTMAQGTYMWSVACTDQALNIGRSQNRTITIDTTPPAAFTLTGPPNDTLTPDPTPTYTWLPTSDAHFANYTVEVSDVEDFSHVNHTFTTSPITNTSVEQDPPLSDGTWYWRVKATDLAGNTRIEHPTIRIDTTPPEPFSLTSPQNNTQVRDTNPTFVWQQSNDANFKNYTLIISDSPAFAHVNYTAGTTQKTETTLSLGVAQNVTWHWRVIAYDQVNLSTPSNENFTYLADFTTPDVTQITPVNNTLITSSSLVNFNFNVTDIGDIENCSLYINDTYDKTLYNPLKEATVTIPSNLENGNYRWYISCTDKAGNTGNSSTRNLSLDVQIPLQTLYESSSGTANYTAPARINLSYSRDAVENQASFSVAGPGLATAVNATMVLNGSGMLLMNNTAVNFSGVFAQSNNNVFFVTWKLTKANATGTTLICQHGDDAAGGVAIGNTVKKTLTGNCTYVGGDLRFYNGDNLTLTVNVYNSGGSARTFWHYWENASSSGVSFKAYKLGSLRTNFTNLTDPHPSEETTFTQRCNTTCSDGTCLNTEVYLQMHNGSAWRNVSTSGNVTLSGNQLNPESLGNINGTNMTDFSLYGETYSLDNRLRCYATSTYSESVGSEKNVTVNDSTAPSVILNSPANGAAMEPQNVTFRYTASDRRLDECTLWGNWSGTWQAEETNTTPQSGAQGGFTPIFLDYGTYRWNVRCSDLAGNSAFAVADALLYVAGDLTVMSANITFSTTAPIEGQNITLYANITNLANRTEPSVKVQFLDGDPALGGTEIGNATVSLARLGYALANVTWIATLGAHNIFVVIDPPVGSGVIIESDETNNAANRSLLITMWQLYFGNVSGQFSLDTSFNTTFLNWSLTNNTGRIYITDADTRNGIRFQYLQALGRNTTGGQDGTTNDDFQELDTLLGTAAFVDSVNNTYTADGGPRATERLVVYGKTVDNVPMANSSANFTTGILWDADDSADARYDTIDAEDVVFVTSIKDAAAGAHGTYDYEIKVPSRLRDYRGATAKVSLYYELE